MKYHLWHKRTKRTAVNLAGEPLTDLSLLDVQLIRDLMHPQVWEQIEVRALEYTN